MTNKCLILFIVLLTMAAFLAPVAADDGPVVATTTTSPPVVETTETVPTFITQPTTAPTTEPTATVPTYVTTPPTTEPTATVPTYVTMPTTLPTQVPTTSETGGPSPGGDKGWITTYCNVDGATVYFDNVPQGTTSGGSLTVSVASTGTPIQTVSVTKSGYTTWQGPLGSMPQNGQTVYVYSTINPLSTPTTSPPVQYGTIYAQSSPSGAQIYMNGNFYGYAPVTIPSVWPGTYTMKATLNGYSPNTQTVTVNSGQTVYYSPVLVQSPNPARTTGTVYVTSSPDHAQVYVDGNYQGKTPITVTLYPGSHTVQLTLSGYNDYSTTVYVNGGTAQNLNAVMTSATYGSVAVTSMSGASVYMDSNLVGKIPSSGTLTLNNILSGNHLFKLTAPGYNDWMNTIYVRGNTITPFTATLVPTGSPVPTTGSINVASVPTGAEVYVDNVFKGYTPALLDGITTGQHQLLLRYTGFLDYTASVTVAAGQTTPVSASLQPAPTPTQSAPSMAVLIGGIAGIIALGAVLRRRS